MLLTYRSSCAMIYLAKSRFRRHQLFVCYNRFLNLYNRFNRSIISKTTGQTSAKPMIPIKLCNRSGFFVCGKSLQTKGLTSYILHFPSGSKNTHGLSFIIKTSASSSSCAKYISMKSLSACSIALAIAGISFRSMRISYSLQQLEHLQQSYSSLIKISLCKSWNCWSNSSGSALFLKTS